AGGVDVLPELHRDFVGGNHTAIGRYGYPVIHAVEEEALSDLSGGEGGAILQRAILIVATDVKGVARSRPPGYQSQRRRRTVRRWIGRELGQDDVVAVASRI